MKKVAFIAKTNLNNDGRILNELRIIKNKFAEDVWIDFILMPDKPLIIDVKEIDRLYVIDSKIRNNRWLRSLTVLDFSFQAIKLLRHLKPDIIHAEDTAITLPVFFYKKFVDNGVKIIYDDHELPNENESFQMKIMQKFERELMNLSDYVIFANEERQSYLAKSSEMVLKNSQYFLNLPYFENSIELQDTIPLIENISREKMEGKLTYIMHQGIIEVERGRKKLAAFSKLLPKSVKILIVGVSREHFDEFINEFNLEISNFCFIGSVPYSVLNEYWKIVDASIVMYLPTYINNQLCAPNRLYISYKHNIPIIVNKDNPVLSNFILNHKCGVFIEDFSSFSFDDLTSVQYSSREFDILIEAEIKKFEKIYLNVLNK